MKARLVGRRASAFERTRLLAFDDRLELLGGGGVTGWEVRRMFFDEIECATVLPQIQWGTVLLLGLLGALLLVPGLALLTNDPVPGAFFGLAGAALLVTAAVNALVPHQRLVVHAPGQVFETLLSRQSAERARVLDDLVRAIESYQARQGAA